MAARKPRPTGPVSPLEHARMVADAMSEGALQAQLDGLGKSLGWRCYHTHDSRGSQRGFLDWVAIRGPRLIFAELKVQSESRGKVSTDQQAWMDDLRGFAEAVAVEASIASQERGDRPDGEPSVEVYLWRPIDITTDTIVRILQ